MYLMGPDAKGKGFTGPSHYLSKCYLMPLNWTGVSNYLAINLLVSLTLFIVLFTCNVACLIPPKRFIFQFSAVVVF